MALRPEVRAGPSAVPALWCAIFQIGGKHATYNCHLLQKYTQNSQQLFCNFCRSLGHDERTCRSYELVMIELLPIEFRPKCVPLTGMQVWRKLDFRGVNKVELEKDWEEVTDN